MKILSGAQMARLDRLSIRRHGISARALMRHAARACCEEILALPLSKKIRRIVVVCGPGNNGGDGFAVAALLRPNKFDLQVFFLGNEAALSEEAHHYHGQAKDMIRPRRAMPAALRRADLVIDAIFGIGLKRPVTGRYAAAIAAINRAPGYKLAVDIPSGISADTGEALGTAFRADLTVTFEAPKWGQILPPAWDFVGRLAVCPIGLSRAELKKMPSVAEWVDADYVRGHRRPRSREAHKGDAGRVLVVAGSREMPGAGYLAAVAALRAGAGVVTWALPEEAFRRIDLRFPEVILLPAPARDGKFGAESFPALQGPMRRFQAMAVGPGLGQGEGLQGFLRELLSARRPPTVLDADALNNVAGSKGLAKRLRGAILTPHLLELSRLSGKSVASIRADPVGAARGFARRHRCWVVLKGYRSVIAGPTGRIWINSVGGPNLATAGSGDVLTGVIAGLLAQGFKPEVAVPCAVFLHGLAGDRLAERLGDRGTIASDIAKEIPKIVWKFCG
ncbi:MAG: NAD(P)H-hydrate dehydratase [Deltaproteobacteria bacterium]|nr:NAD(P)H-hydrate dehydratase [Deltaproteobacteria bacterium]